ncbi:quinone oxidoreductase/Zn-containing alcohol dehydrogenase, putative (plasmid) [Acaryochloris marina MBIC11017]|uniref:Quinone oxidoreductase/Zn-containing alcohol dehydrogenase, putative n=1 Tax=Acaryochloris marina (strain MBIC 11017) TaxID=329726 RepID=A8ZMF7_ACAM1|nr:quinone oxidoreductase/Zn-containing alcohol dehydrogenase, putative [Acaryochloris marina MBIC11017]
MTIQTMMRAIHMTKIGGPEVLQLAHAPRSIAQANEALIRLSYSGVNYNDVMVRTDFFRHPGASAPELPLILGEEGAGIVEAVGSDDDNFTPGQRVGFFWDKTKTYAEYAAVPAEKLFVLPDDISEEVAVALIHSGLTARALLYEYRPIEKDMPVLITGASGSIGSVLVPWASQLGAKVIATVTSVAQSVGYNRVSCITTHLCRDATANEALSSMAIVLTITPFNQILHKFSIGSNPFTVFSNMASTRSNQPYKKTQPASISTDKVFLANPAPSDLPSIVAIKLAPPINSKYCCENASGSRTPASVANRITYCRIDSLTLIEM